MLGALAAGIVAAVLVAVPAWAQARFPAVFYPVWVPAVAVVAVLLQRFVLDMSRGTRSGGRAYDGMADLLIHIHSPSSPEPGLRWLVRGLGSLMLSVFGGMAGPEGAAVEVAHALALALRPRSARWLEPRRRTDASTALAAGVSAAFGAPFAGFLLPVELGMGGRAANLALGSLVAFAAAQGLRHWMGLELPDIASSVAGLGAADPRAWVGAVAVGLAAGVAGAGLSRFFRYAQDSLLDLFRTQAWMRILCAGVMLFLVVLAVQGAHQPAPAWLAQAASGMAAQAAPGVAGTALGAGALALVFVATAFSLAMVLAGFGTIGLFWPVLAMGAIFGATLARLAGPWLAAGPLLALMALAGGSAFWATLLGAPFAGAVVALELAREPAVLLPCLASALIAQAVRRRLRSGPLAQGDLEARGLGLVGGRSAGVLGTIPVREAMVTDYEVVSEHEPLSEIRPRLLKSRYPFFPVVNPQGIYSGLLTTDVIQEAWLAQSEHSNTSLAGLFEAKDLLYRSGIRTPTVLVSDRLSAAAGMFESSPCVPALSDDGRIVGLLFSHNVRLAYDREMARRALEEE
jgi:H+/Cl- antiporter ClcA